MKIPYKLVTAMSLEGRHEQMAIAIKRGLPRLKQVPIDDSKSVSIACYGPSLEDTWQDLTRPICTVSGALHYLYERGITPDFHIDVDPRKHKIKHITPPVDGVHYLMASVCSPETWEILKDQKVTIWHAVSGVGTDQWLARNDPGELLITGGSTVGMAAVQVMGCLGFRHFEIHGMDGCLRDGRRHAGPHYGHKQGGIVWQAGHVQYQTSKIMANACSEFINMCRLYPIFVVIHGEGLQQALIDEEYDLPNVARAGRPYADVVRKARAVIVEKAA